MGNRKNLTPGDVNTRILAILSGNKEGVSGWINLNEINRNIEPRQHEDRLKKQIDGLVKRGIILGWSDLQNTLENLCKKRDELSQKFDDRQGDLNELAEQMSENNKKLIEILKELEQGEENNEKTSVQIIREVKRKQEIKRNNNYKITKIGLEKWNKIKIDCLDEEVKRILLGIGLQN